MLSIDIMTQFDMHTHGHMVALTCTHTSRKGSDAVTEAAVLSNQQFIYQTSAPSSFSSLRFLLFSFIPLLSLAAAAAGRGREVSVRI